MDRELNKALKIIREEYLKRVVDECCDLYDDVTVVDVCPDQFICGYRVELRTPAYGTFLTTKGHAFVIAMDDFDNWTEAQLRDVILSHVKKVHDDRNCSVREPNISRDWVYHTSRDEEMLLKSTTKNEVRKEYDKMFSNKRTIGLWNTGLSIKNVIFNYPATIVFWNDNTKTVVKADGEIFDPEKGLAMAIAKKMMGNKGNYYDEFKKWLPEEKERRKRKNERIKVKYEEENKTCQEV